MNHHFSRLASIFSAMLITFGVSTTSLAENQGISISKKPLPTGVFQRYGISSGGGVVELKDGSLMLADGGHSWGKFKTLELSEGLEDRDRVPLEFPIKMVRARDWVGPLPDRWAFFHYPNVDVVGDSIIVRYAQSSPLQSVAGRRRTEPGQAEIGSADLSAGMVLLRSVGLPSCLSDLECRLRSLDHRPLKAIGFERPRTTEQIFHDRHSGNCHHRRGRAGREPGLLSGTRRSGKDRPAG